MTKNFKLLPPTMPNFLFIEMPPRPRQEGVSFDNKIPITDLSEQEATEYAELMKQAFINHWKNKKKQ